jgi:ketosteroid isomerase-like protein
MVEDLAGSERTGLSGGEGITAVSRGIIGEVSEQSVEIAECLLATVFIGDLVKAADDEARIRETDEAIAKWAVPDFEWAMLGPAFAPGGALTGRGLEEFREAWRDWMSPFESYEVHPGETIDAGDRVLTLVRQVGRTRTGGVEVENFGAGVVWVRDGRMTRVELHLDRDAAMKAAGLSE